MRTFGTALTRQHVVRQGRDLILFFRGRTFSGKTPVEANRILVLVPWRAPNLEARILIKRRISGLKIEDTNKNTNNPKA
jgi:hypothetical protein